MSESIPLSVPYLNGNEWKYVKECLDTNWVSSAGKFVDLFEQNICKYTGSKYAVACVNGTAALHISLILAGVGSGDEVIVPTLTFIAPINTVKYVGAEPIFMDADKYYNIDISKTIDFINNETNYKDGYTYNKHSGKRITAIIPVHVFGNPVNLEPLIAVCQKKNIKVIEDATESLGAYYNRGVLSNKNCGTVGDIGCYSFNGNKIITTGGGGMIVTDNEYYAERAKYLTTQAKDDEIKYIHKEVGYNYRLTNVQAAIGVAQLEQIEKFIEIKKRNYEIYKNNLQRIPGLSLGETPEYAEANYWFYALKIDEQGFGNNSNEVFQHLKGNNIQVRPVWHLNHLQKPFTKNVTYKIENAYELHKRTLNLPCSISLSRNDILKITTLLAEDYD